MATTGSEEAKTTSDVGILKGLLTDATGWMVGIDVGRQRLCAADNEDVHCVYNILWDSNILNVLPDGGKEVTLIHASGECPFAHTALHGVARNVDVVIGNRRING